MLLHEDALELVILWYGKRKPRASTFSTLHVPLHKRQGPIRGLLLQVSEAMLVSLHIMNHSRRGTTFLVTRKDKRRRVCGCAGVQVMESAFLENTVC